MSTRHQQELKACMRSVESLEQEKARLLASIDGDEQELKKGLDSNGWPKVMLPPDGPEFVARQKVGARLSSGKARVMVIDDALRTLRPRIEQLNCWVFAEKRYEADVAIVRKQAKEGERIVGALDHAGVKRAELVVMRDAAAAAAQREEEAASSKAAASLLKKIGMTVRGVTAGEEGTSTPSPTGASKLSDIDAAIGAVDAEIAALKGELDEVNTLADEANRRSLIEAAHMAAMHHDDALRIYAASWADFRAIHRTAFDQDPELPDFSRLADELDAAQAGGNEPAPRKRGVMSFLGGAA